MRRLLTKITAAGLAGGVFVSAALAQTRADFVARMDTDSDGRVSLPEYTEYMSYAFRRMDADGNGVLEPSEQLVPNAKRLTLVEHHANLAAMFHRQDSNHDGYLSAAELSAPPR
ncbi:MAG: EF-hand domain-containing protein [Burkholderiales bacterium]